MRDIVVYTEQYQHCGSGLRYAAALAAECRGIVSGLYICPIALYASPPVYAPELTAAIVRTLRELKNEAIAAGTRLAEDMRLPGQRACRWLVAEGYVPDVIRRVADRHNAVVLERGDAAWSAPEALAQMVLGIHEPCFVVPPDFQASGRPRCVALAWNDSPEAMRAIHASMPLLEHAERIVLLRGERRDRFAEIDWSPSFDIADYFLDHGLAVTQQELPGRDADAGPALLAACTELGADLLVMGAYGHTRLREWVFGGATRHVLRHAALPVLLRH